MVKLGDLRAVTESLKFAEHGQVSMLCGCDLNSPGKAGKIFKNNR